VQVLRHVADSIHNPALLRELLGDQIERTVSLTLLSVDGNQLLVTFEWRPKTGPPLEPSSQVAIPSVDTTQIGWGFSDSTKQVAILRVGRLMHYREAGEVWLHSGHRDSLRSWYKEVHGVGPVNDASLRAFLQKSPAATPILTGCLQAMYDAQTPWLIVDLTESTGGNSIFGHMLGWALYGSEAFGSIDKGYQIPRYSRLYEENFGQIPGAKFSLGGYDFRSERFWQARHESHRRRSSDWMDMVPTFQHSVDTIARWRPRVVAVTGARTYSAGFDVLLTLKSLGALHVGVPSSQAPNCFIDTLQFTLPHSKLSGTISFKQRIAMPFMAPTVRHMDPDVPLTFDRLRSYKFDPAAGVRLALESISAVT
jgi:hypothetical protein